MSGRAVVQEPLGNAREIKREDLIALAADRRLRVAFICGGDPESALTWSGTPLHMLNALRGEFDVVLVVRRPWDHWAQLSRRLVRRLSRGAVDLAWLYLFRKYATRNAVAQIIRSQCDAVFAVAVTPICAELVCKRPTVFVSDATLLAMVNYNPQFTALLSLFKKQAENLESHCIQNAVLALFPSEWARRSAITDHGGMQDRTAQISWGANMLANQVTAPESRSATAWRLLFIGTNWFGKGGDIALQTIEDMRRQGFDVHLDVIGSAPAKELRLDHVTFHGFLDKRVPAELRLIENLYAKAHVFFLPTRFDALGIVFAEAASYAIPAVSYATGGVPAMVTDGITGLLLPEGAPASAFATTLIDLLSNRRRYIEMSHAALDASRNRLNWQAWAKRVKVELETRLVAS